MENKNVVHSFGKSTYSKSSTLTKTTVSPRTNNAEPNNDVFADCNTEIDIENDSKSIKSVFSHPDLPQFDCYKNLSKQSNKAKYKAKRQLSYKNDFEIDILFRVCLMKKKLGNKYQRYFK